MNNWAVIFMFRLGVALYIHFEVKEMEREFLKIAETTDQLTQLFSNLVDEVIGEDELLTTQKGINHISNPHANARNYLRTEQRARLKQVLSDESKENRG